MSQSELPPIVAVIGFKDSGKTSTAVALVAALVGRGHRVAAIKHGHGFRLDTEGTDSWRLRHEGGADRVVLTGPEGFAVMGDWRTEGTQPELHELVRRHGTDADIVVAEGFKHARVPKIEVYRTDAHEDAIYGSGLIDDSDVLGLVTDRKDWDPGVPCFDLSDPELGDRLADLVESSVLGGRTADG